MNLPNKLTVLRMALVPFFVFFLLAGWMPHHYLFALVLFCAASYTDHLDGKIARKQNLVTNFGKFMDPLADKILVISALVCFVQLGLANIWFVLIIIAREFMVTSIRLVAADSGVVIAANKWGKAKTVSQLIAVILVMALQYILGFLGGDAGLYSAWFLLASEALIFISVVFTVISGLVYLKQNWAVVSSSK